LDFQISWPECLFLAVCHILASAVVWQSGWPIGLCLALTLLLAGHAWYQLLRCLLLLESSIVQVRLDTHGRAWLTSPGGESAATLHRVVYQSAMLTMLDFKINREGRQACFSWVPVSSKVRVLVAAGSVPTSQRKQLACFLTYGMQNSTVAG